MFAFALMGGGPLPYSLGIFMGALAASLLGKPAQWQLRGRRDIPHCHLTVNGLLTRAWSMELGMYM